MLTFILTSLLVCAVVADNAGETNVKEWAYEWYTGDTFTMLCNATYLNTQASEDVVWTTPTNQTLDKNSPEDDNYKVDNMSDVGAFKLQIKRVTSAVHGVYRCEVFTGNTPRNHTIFALNIHSEKFHKLFDKYRYNLIVAVIATAVFLVPLSTICVVYQFQYQSDEDKQRSKENRAARKYKHNTIGQEMQEDHKNGLAASVKSPEGEGAYENPDLSTQL